VKGTNHLKFILGFMFLYICRLKALFKLTLVYQATLITIWTETFAIIMCIKCNTTKFRSFIFYWVISFGKFSQFFFEVMIINLVSKVAPK
jgi:hypothetical protein